MTSRRYLLAPGFAKLVLSTPIRILRRSGYPGWGRFWPPRLAIEATLAGTEGTGAVWLTPLRARRLRMMGAALGWRGSVFSAAGERAA